MEPIILPRISDQKPLVTVISITYNHEPYIRDCLEGFLMQKTNFPLEVIIHDDASTDHTSDIIREYYEKRPDLFHVIIERENQYSQGKSVSIPLYEMAQGKYIALCEGDDYWTDPLKLQKQFDFIETHPDCSLCFHAIDEISDDYKTSNHLRVKYGKNKPQDIFPTWRIPTCSTLMKKECTVEYLKIRKRYKGFYCGDIVLFLSATRIGYLYGLKDKMAVYRRHSTGATVQTIGKLSLYRQFAHLNAVKKAFPELKDNANFYNLYTVYVMLKRHNYKSKYEKRRLLSLLRKNKIKYHIQAVIFYLKSIVELKRYKKEKKRGR